MITPTVCTNWSEGALVPPIPASLIILIIDTDYHTRRVLAAIEQDLWEARLAAIMCRTR